MALKRILIAVLLIAALTVESVGCGSSNNNSPSGTPTKTGGGASFNVTSILTGSTGPISNVTLAGTWHPNGLEGSTGAAGKWTDPATGITWAIGGNTSLFPSNASTDGSGNYTANKIYTPDYWLINLYTAGYNKTQCAGAAYYLDPLFPLEDQTNYFVCESIDQSHDKTAQSMTASTTSATMSPSSVNVSYPPSTFTVSATGLDNTWGPSIVELGNASVGWTEMDATSQNSKSMTLDAPDFSGYRTQTLQFAVFNIDGHSTYYAVGGGTISVRNPGNCS